MNSIQKAILPLAIAALCWLGASAQTSSSQSKSSTSTEHTTAKSKAAGERTFLREAGYADLAEVQLGQLAEQRASSPEVKQFAERMVNDHTKNDDQLKQVAQQERVTLPDKLSPKAEATKARLEKLSGKEFDHAYMLDMVRDHTTDVAKFKAESQENVSPAVKNYVDQTLPTLESHLKEARSVEPQTTGAVHKTGTSKTS
jgi:putative membrane protein